jgi:hypothetical protein
MCAGTGRLFDTEDAVDLARPITVTKKVLRDVLDVATMSMDFASGFMDDEQVEALRTAAVALGIDQMVVTPSHYVCKYRGTHQWELRHWGVGHRNEVWWCVNCQHTSNTRPPDAEVMPDARN